MVAGMRAALASLQAQQNELGRKVLASHRQDHAQEAKAVGGNSRSISIRAANVRFARLCATATDKSVGMTVLRELLKNVDLKRSPPVRAIVVHKPIQSARAAV